MYSRWRSWRDSWGTPLLLGRLVRSWVSQWRSWRCCSGPKTRWDSTCQRLHRWWGSGEKDKMINPSKMERNLEMLKMTWSPGSNLYLRSSTHTQCLCVSVTFQKHSCFQEIHTLQSKRTDVGELEKEREEAVQRLQVRPPVDPAGWTNTSGNLHQQSSYTNVYHGNHSKESSKTCQVRGHEIAVVGTVSVHIVSTVTDLCTVAFLSFHGPGWSLKPLSPSVGWFAFLFPSRWCY